MQEVGGEKRLQLWVDVAGGLSRGNCYGTGALSFNIRPGVSHLTQECCPPENEVIEMFRQEAAAARAEAAAANQRAAEADQRSQQLENQFSTAMEEFRKRMEALENQSGDGSCSTIRSRHTQHPHYDPALDDQSEDDLT
jgi:hypothetical protein